MTRPEDAPPTHEAADRAVRSLFQVGRLWASHGLEMGRMTLRTAAKTLESTAETLEDLSQRVAPDDERTADERTAD